jgi:LacI family transcriptional regulator
MISGIGKQDGFNRESGKASMRALLPLLRGADPVTAVFVASDVQAIGVLETAREAGIQIPEDLALVSFDDIELAAHAELSTMRQPMYEMGTLALERLFQRTKNPGAEPRLTSFTPRLIIRRSCGATAAHQRPGVDAGLTGLATADAGM